MDLDDIDGYRLRRPLGSGSVGTVWLARDLTSGRPVAIKRVPAASVPGAEAFRRDLALARGLGHRHAVRLLEVRQAGREWQLVCEYVGAGSLTDLLQRRGPLSTGELVTLLSPLAQALAAAHQRGLQHGHLGAGDVLLTADGRPQLADLGLRSTTGQHATPSDDLTAFGALARAAGGDPAVFGDALFGGDGTTLAKRLLALAEPQPIALGFGRDTADPATPDPAAGSPGSARQGGPAAPIGSAQASAGSGDGSAGSGEAATGATGPRRGRGADPWGRVGSHAAPELLPEHGVRRQRARLLIGLAVSVIAVGTLLALGLNLLRGGGVSSAGTTPIGTTPAASQTSPPALPSTEPSRVEPPGRAASRSASGERSVRAWTATLAALDAQRALAFARLDPGVLDTVYQRGSRPWASDRALLASYRERQVRVHGLRIQIHRVAVERPYGAAVVLRVVDRFAGATAVDASGRRFALPAGPETTRLITLAGGPGRWRITSIVRP